VLSSLAVTGTLGSAAEQMCFLWQVKRGGLSPEEATASLDRITPMSSLDGFKKAEFVIEAVVEDEDVKKAVFRKLDQVGNHAPTVPAIEQ
jgi:3-hydroxyacyl-CoA dehydrogenase